jgi:hypothetical protein
MLLFLSCIKRKHHVSLYALVAQDDGRAGCGGHAAPRKSQAGFYVVKLSLAGLAAQLQNDF